MIKERLIEISKREFQKPLEKLTKEQIYIVLLNLCKESTKKLSPNKNQRKLYYVSAEFLIGKLLSCNLLNLGIYEEVKQALEEVQIDITEIEEIENEPSLGNGGLGRLAACFMDSIATLGLEGDGIGINYHLGLFKQQFENNKQVEYPNPWIDNKSFLIDTKQTFPVEFANCKVQAHLYDIDVIGYKSGYNKLHLFDVDTVDEKIVKEGIDFDKTDIKKNLTLFLYPDDSDEKGRLLRIYQQYFMVSAGAQLIIKELKEQGKKLKDLDKYVIIQINDTHPTMIIPELIRLLEKEGIKFEEAVEIVTRATAYTNHTILAEALEKWPYEYLEKVVPNIVEIIDRLNKLINEKYKRRWKVRVIDKDKKVHMANIAIHFSSSTNGVAKLHTGILKKSELKSFYNIYPEKFNNKTNGITFRRWLMSCNKELTEYIKQLIGDEFEQDATKLEQLEKYKNDEEVLNKILEIKQNHKKNLAKYIQEKEKIKIDPNSIYDIQIKRLHEYKRQQMNLLYVIEKYQEIKSGKLPKRPITVIFGAKAAPAYTIAKDIIHLALCLQELIDKDPSVNKHLKLVMVTNYNVSYAEKLIPAADISEQISLASKEASGTGNMKLMLNGAITLGTLDGANVEIKDLVGRENIYIFGKTSNQVINLYRKNSYDPKEYMKDKEIKKLVDFIISKELLKLGDKESLTRLHKEIITKDYFMALLDLKDYIKVKNQMFEDYENRKKWAKMMLINISQAGFFSSDRTIQQYNEDIWHLK